MLPLKIMMLIILSIALMMGLAACGNGPTAPVVPGAEAIDTTASADITAPVNTATPAFSAAPTPGEDNTATADATQAPATFTVFYIHVGDTAWTVIPADNSSAEAFMALLAEGDVTIDMRDYGNFEKVGGLGTSLPTNDTSITTQPGDVILYQGNAITIYYDVNTWSFTRLGKIANVSEDEMRAVLGAGDVSVRFSLSE